MFSGAYTHGERNEMFVLRLKAVRVAQIIRFSHHPRDRKSDYKMRGLVGTEKNSKTRRQKVGLLGFSE
jgi:hypothetical protein